MEENIVSVFEVFNFIGKFGSLYFLGVKKNLSQKINKEKHHKN